MIISTNNYYQKVKNFIPTFGDNDCIRAVELIGQVKEIDKKLEKRPNSKVLIADIEMKQKQVLRLIK